MKWTIQDLKDKGIFVKDGVGKKLKNIPQPPIDKDKIKDNIKKNGKKREI